MQQRWRHGYAFYKYGMTSMSDLVSRITGEQDEANCSLECIALLNKGTASSPEEELISMETIMTEFTFKDLEGNIDKVDSDLASQKAMKLLCDSKVNITPAEAVKMNDGKKLNVKDAHRIIDQLETTGGNENIIGSELREGQTMVLTSALLRALDNAIQSAAWRLTSSCRLAYDIVTKEPGETFDPKYMPPEELASVIAMAMAPGDYIVSQSDNSGDRNVDLSGGERKVLTDGQYELLKGAEGNTPGADRDPVLNRIVDDAALVKALTTKGFHVRDSRSDLCDAVYQRAISNFRQRQERAENAKRSQTNKRHEAAKEVDVGF